MQVRLDPEAGTLTRPNGADESDRNGRARGDGGVDGLDDGSRAGARVGDVAARAI
jgi:hypothetical protein